MATPNARQISFGTSVVPKLEAASTSTQVTREDGTTTGIASYTDVILDTTVAKRFGGKGTVTIAADQEIDGWVSFFHPADAEIDGLDSLWNLEETNWDEVVEVTSTDHTLRDDKEDCNFLYMKNTGSVEARIILDGTEPDLLLPPGASISLRLNSVASANIKADTSYSSTTIEYVLAKE